MRAVLRILDRGWISLVLIVSMTVSGFAMYKMHGIFGSHTANSASSQSNADDIVEFNPKHVLYEISGPPATTGSVSFLDADDQPHREDFTRLPWTHLVTTTLPTIFANVVAQGDADNISCQITVNGQVRDQNSVTGQDAQAFCLVKAA
ncbi:hypothetical protein BRW65_00030 [Mycobacterium paraffinicum]|uniref:Transport acessory protein MmpS n=1 Tax=Mycobacterium paraffinicum TaxID=53378 RepID=A0A1Q4I1Z5_9MYCO|nr:MmpS family transport accessory protein [Mycobacterium paraffinicum]OJZ75900.1 hypothetical protein BRW65_00030 [Mycobacterium paraffinicum]